MLVEVTFIRDARSVTQLSPEIDIEPDNVVAGVMIREPRAVFVAGIGGVGTPLVFSDSIVSDSGVVTLENDLPAPGVSMVYSTDGGGVRGWHVQPVIAPSGNYLVSGGGVAWTGTGLNYRVSAAVYVIAGIQYTSTEVVMTLTASDPTQDRIDVVAVDNTGSVVVITGTPGGPPIAPSVDPSSQLQLTFIYVPAGATIPPVTTVNIYLENTEWTTSVPGITSGIINPASTNNPFAGIKDIEGTNVGSGNYVNLANPVGGGTKISDYDNLVLQIRSKAIWPNPKSLSIFFNIGTAVTLRSGTFGFDSNNTTGYQQIVIPTSLFNTGTGMATSLRATVAGGGGPIGFYIDNIILQGGGAPPPPTGGDFSTNTNLSVAGELVLFADATGKLGQRSSGSGYFKLVSGVLTPVSLLGNFFFGLKNPAGLAAGKLAGYWTCDFAGSITAWNLIVDVGTITIKIWKIAAGTASPTSANSITPSGLALVTGTALHSVSLGGFSTLAVAYGDILACEITAVGGSVKDFGGSIEITKT